MKGGAGDASAEVQTQTVRLQRSQEHLNEKALHSDNLGADAPDSSIVVASSGLSKTGTGGAEKTTAKKTMVLGSRATPWTLEDAEVKRYVNVFQVADEDGVGFVPHDVAKVLLEKSDLPRAELLHIWAISDRDGDGRLSLPEFVCAVHLANRRRQGVPLPGVVPPEVLAGLAKVERLRLPKG